MCAHRSSRQPLANPHPPASLAHGGEPHASLPTPDASGESDDSSGADSLASIDTISVASSDRSGDLDGTGEKNWRIRKLLKYARWKTKLESATDDQGDTIVRPSNSKGIGDLEQRIARQERKLQELEGRRLQPTDEAQPQRSD